MNSYNMGVDLEPVSDAVVGFGLSCLAVLCVLALYWVICR